MLCLVDVIVGLLDFSHFILNTELFPPNYSISINVKLEFMPYVLYLSVLFSLSIDFRNVKVLSGCMS